MATKSPASISIHIHKKGKKLKFLPFVFEAEY